MYLKLNQLPKIPKDLIHEEESKGPVLAAFTIFNTIVSALTLFKLQPAKVTWPYSRLMSIHKLVRVLYQRFSNDGKPKDTSKLPCKFLLFINRKISS